MNFQHTGDKFPANNLNVDRQGNTVYLSLGPGWYIIPYFFYQWLDLPAVPVYLRILNLLFHLLSVILFFCLLEQLVPREESNRYFIILCGCIFMIFSPGILWFLGNGYINVGVMIPFVISVFLLILPMLKDPGSISVYRLVLLFVLIVALVFIDWYILILGFLLSIATLLKCSQNKKYTSLLLVIIFSVCSGITLVFFQFASHAGKQAVVEYWFHRYSYRGLNLAGSSFATRLFYFFAYFFTSYLPLILVLLITYIRNWKSKFLPQWSSMEIYFIRLFFISLLLYNILLFEWSSEHEFSVLPWCLLLSYTTARVLGSSKNIKVSKNFLLLFFVTAIVQYYWINRPGTVSRDGLTYDSFKRLGISLSQIPPDYTICINLEQNPMVEYYAGRNILRAADSISVKPILRELGIQKAVWISHKNYQLENIQVIH
jgi:hypothetical protein